MGELVKPTQKFASQMIDEVAYLMFSHFLMTSAVLILIFVVIGLFSGSMLVALAIGSFFWAFLVVGCAKYCELIANQRNRIQS